MTKRFFLAIALIIASVASLSAEISAQAKRFRTEIQTFLREEGFSPYIDEDDESVDFKKEGTLYWININGDGPYYLEFHRGGFKRDGEDEIALLKAANEGNRKIRCAKAILLDNAVGLVIEMFAHTAEDFKYVFYSSIKELDNLHSTVQDAYTEYSGSSDNSSSNYSSGNYSSSGSSYYDKFFPIYGFNLGQSTSRNFSAAGYEIETESSGSKDVMVNGVRFWDFDKDDVYEMLAMNVTSDKVMPAPWAQLGLTVHSSWNQVKRILQNAGFNVTIDEQPHVVDGALKGEMTGKSPDGKLKINIEFENRTGRTVDASDTMSYIFMWAY